MIKDEQIQSGELMIAHAKDPKLKVQFRLRNGPDIWNNSTSGRELAWNFESFIYRIAPTPKLRPWKPEEVPLPSVIRSKETNARWLALTASVSGISTANCNKAGETVVSSFVNLLEHNEHSTDSGKTWLPCGVLEDQQ
jgi:hypothetical protein